MIEKKKEDYLFVEGSGRPYQMIGREPIEKTTSERQNPIMIRLGSLNGQDGNGRAPKNFYRKAGRTLGSFVRPDFEDRELEDAFDIE